MFKCKGCTERKLGCHSTCESYLKEKAALEEIRAKKRSDVDYYAYKSDSFKTYIAKSAKKKNRRTIRRKRR